MKNTDNVLKQVKVASYIDEKKIIYSGVIGNSHISYTNIKISQFQTLPVQQSIQLNYDVREKINQQMYINQLFSQEETILRYRDADIKNFHITYVHQKIQNTLKDQISKNILTYQQKIQFFCNIVQAVKTLHKRSIVHRLIRPENIAICFSNNKKVGKLMNFSKTIKKTYNKKLLSEQILQIYKVKKSPYLAPQVYLKQQESFGIDIWSLGVLLYQMLFDDLMGIKINQKDVDIFFPQTTPYWLIDFIQKMLAFKPSDRHCIEDVEIISRCARNCSQFTDISKRNFD